MVGVSRGTVSLLRSLAGTTHERLLALTEIRKGTSSAGGARAATGMRFQAEVFAWWATCAVSDTPPGMNLRPNTKIVAVGCETEFPVDDVAVALSDGGFVLIQAKYGMQKLDSRRDDVLKAVNQLVNAFLAGLETSSGKRPIDIERDRLVIATNINASASFKHLGKVLERLRGQPESYPASRAARSEQERKAWATFTELVERSLQNASPEELHKVDLYRDFYRAVAIQRFDFGPDTGKDFVRARELLSTVGATRSFSELVRIGITAASNGHWHQTQQMAAMLGISSPALPNAEESSADHITRVREARPRLLGVHDAIRPAGAATELDELPTYVPRDIDNEIRTQINYASRQGGFVLLIGGSSTGKTRSLFEAIKSELPDWWLLHPSDITTLSKFIAAPTPQSVVWLDEIQRYLENPGQLSPDIARRMINAGYVLVGTMWRDQYHAWIAEHGDKQKDAVNNSNVLKLAKVIAVPEALSRKEVRFAERLSKTDSRIRIALNDISSGFTQVLAAGPQLINHWEEAPDSQCYGKAVITAALDARRVGFRAPLTRDHLAMAAPGYLKSEQQATAPENWLDQALSYATERMRGAASALRPVSTGMGNIAGYTTADYLYQHALRVRRTDTLPDTAWRAMVEYHQESDASRLADSARRRDRLHEAELLYRASLGESSLVARSLAELLETQGRIDEAIQVLRPYSNSKGDILAAVDFARMLGSQGRLEELEEFARINEFAVDELIEAQAISLIKEGKIDEVSKLFKLQFGDDFGRHAIDYWKPIDLMLESGWTDHAKVILEAQASAGNLHASRRLADLLASRQEFDELQARAVDDPHIARKMAELALEHGWSDQAIRILQNHITQGELVAAMALADLFRRQGRFDEAAEIERQEYGNASFQSGHTARMLLAHDRLEELADLINSGDLTAVYALAEFGAVDFAIDLLRDLTTNGGHWSAHTSLISLLVENNRIEELQDEVAAGTPGAVEGLRTLQSKQTENLHQKARNF